MKETTPNRGEIEYVGLMVSTLMLTAEYLGIPTRPGMPVIELCGAIKARIERGKVMGYGAAHHESLQRPKDS